MDRIIQRGGLPMIGMNEKLKVVMCIFGVMHNSLIHTVKIMHLIMILMIMISYL